MLDTFILKVKRADSPLYRFLKSGYRTWNTGHIPVPNALKPVGKALYHLHFFFFWNVLRRLGALLYWEPMFRSRCESVGHRLYLERIPEALGHTIIRIGDDVRVHGKIGIYSGRVFDDPRLIVGNRVSIGHQCSFSVNQEIVIEDDVLIAARCTFADNDGHPLHALMRAAGQPPPAEKIRPIRICRYAWIGAGSYILKGVVVGEGAVVGANSVVTSSVPPYTVVAGNPATVLKQLASGESKSQANSSAT